MEESSWKRLTVTAASIKLSRLLVDTWWFGLTQRVTEKRFRELGRLRIEQGFSAIQLVVGIPPEVGPLNENAKSDKGYPWTLDGLFNDDYLELAKERIRFLNELGLRVIVYGAWGHQIDWLGVEKITQWWFRIIEALDDLDVAYCLTGESNLWIQESYVVLPDRSTDDPALPRFHWLSGKLRKRIDRALIRLSGARHKRRRAWSRVLASISQRTEKPIIIHPTGYETGMDTVHNPELLAVDTAQTGHSPETRHLIWQLPLHLKEKNPELKGYINLEPWYEGILDGFGAEDQLFAYWASMLAGAISHCYGAHGVWNAGDGAFLSHWGKQTLDEAVALETPQLLGLSHKAYLSHLGSEPESFCETNGDHLVAISLKTTAGSMHFYPDASKAPIRSGDEVWLPLKGCYAKQLPPDGPAVLISNHS